MKFKSIVYRINFCFKITFLKILKKINISYSINSLYAPSSKIEIGKNSNVSIGKKFVINKRSQLLIRDFATVKIGNNVAIGCDCYFAIRKKISIGSNVAFAPNVKIFDHDHDITKGLVDNNWWDHFLCEPVSIGDNVWIGTNVVILKGVTIGNNCVIAAGSILTKSVPDNTIVIQKRHSDYLEVNHEENIAYR